MARTKQTARKKRGGTTPRMSLGASSNRHELQVQLEVVSDSTVSEAAPLADGLEIAVIKTIHDSPVPCGNTLAATSGVHEPEPQARREGPSSAEWIGNRPFLDALCSSEQSQDSDDRNNDLCHMCADGGDLWRCDHCIRSECKKCIVVPPEHLATAELKDVKYLCLSCHLMDNIKSKTVTPYMGFYQNGKPALPHPPTVHGRFELSSKSFIQAPTTVILHLRLKTIPAKGPINMLYDFLQPYFIRTGGLAMRDVPFDLGTEGKRKMYLENATEIAKRIFALKPSKVIFAISTHTDDDRGDQLAGLAGGKMFAAEIWEFFDVLLGPFEDITRGAILYMLSCGRYMRHSSTRGEFTRVVAKFGFSASIGFDASRFHPSIAWAFLVTVTESVVLHGHSFEDAVPVALGKSNNLNRHCGVYVLLLSPDLKVIYTTRYLWAHSDYRPWGKDIPLQCPSCGAVQERWKRTTTRGGYQFQCRNTNCPGDGKRSGPYTFDVKKPERLTVLPYGKSEKSAWTRRHLRPVPVVASR